MSADTLPSLLNRCTAIIRCGASTIKECAKDIGERQERVSEWVTQRKYRPSGEVTLKLQSWAAKKTIQISRGPNDLQQRYRGEYQLATERFPVNGNRED